jgi:hypothetical protein
VAVIQQGHSVLYREAHTLVDELADAQLAGTRKATWCDQAQRLAAHVDSGSVQALAIARVQVKKRTLGAGLMVITCPYLAVP